jgi:uncharacterized membrane protein
MSHAVALRPHGVHASRLEAAMALLALAGLSIAAYLSIAHLASAQAFCPAGGGCERVQSSEHLQPLGVYIPYIAAVGYTAILASLALASERARFATAAMAYAGAAMTAYVTYLQAFVIRDWCSWCVASTLIMWTLAMLASARFVRG